MTELVDCPSTYGELPSLSPANMTYEELEYKYNKLRRENHQLQLRILGVNELARLLQDRNELVAVLKEKNKRLDISVVRLENRCANFERQIKSQKSSSVASAKPGQSPFIPGPSKQILQGLWQENEELKKTVNNLQKKGSSGYLEAVKTTQLEEFIEHQKCEIEQLRKQIESLAMMGEEEGSAPSSGGRGAVSLQASVTDTGPLKKQLVKMQQTMMVKDRFCTLLSQQVTELQRKLNSLHASQTDGVGTENGPSSSQLSGDVDKYKELLEGKDKELETSRQDNLKLSDELSGLQVEVKDLKEQNETQEQKCSDITQLYSATKSELDLAWRKLDAFMSGNGSETSIVDELNQKIAELQKTMDDQVDSYSREMRSLENNLKASNIELDETNMKLGTAQSQLSAMEGEKKALEKQVIIQKGLSSKRETEVKKKSLECQNKDEMINDLRNQLTKVQDDLEDAQIEMADRKEKKLNAGIQQMKEKYYGHGQNTPTPSFTMTAGGAPSLLTKISHGQEAMLKDGASNYMPELMSRDSTSNQTPKTQATPVTTVTGGVASTMSNQGHSAFPDNTSIMSGVVPSGMMAVSSRGNPRNMVGYGQPIHKPPPNALPLQQIPGSTNTSNRSRSPSIPPTYGGTTSKRPTPLPVTTPHPTSSSMFTPSTPHNPAPHQGQGPVRHATSSTSPVPMMSSQPGAGFNIGMTGQGGQLSTSVPLTGASRYPNSQYQHNALAYGGAGYPRGGGNMMGGTVMRHAAPPSGGRPAPSITAPAHMYGGSRIDASYNPMAQGQGGQSNLPSHFSQGSWPGDMRDHTSSGSTSPHHHDNQPHYGSGHPHNPNNYR